MIRIICPVNKEKRKEEKKEEKDFETQYTATLLPDFLQSYSRRLTETIFYSADSYIRREEKNYETAAMGMEAENGKTFIKYYKRIIQRLISWNTFLSKKIAEYDASFEYSKQPEESITIPIRWEEFKKLSKELNHQIIKYHSKIGITDVKKIRYTFVLLNLNVSGLGP